MGWMTGVQFLAEAGILFLHYSIQTGSGVHPPSCPTGMSGSYPGCKVARVWKLTTHLHLVLRLRFMELYLHYPTCLHGMVI